MELFPNFDELQDAVFSLQLVSELLEKVDEDCQHWKWVLVALHNSMQGFMVAALKGSDQLAVISDKNVKLKKAKAKWIQFLTGRGREKPPPLPKLADFWELYDKIKSLDYMARLSGGRRFEPTARQEQSVKDLVQIRNGFTHFWPSRKLESAIDFLRIVSDCLEIICFLAFESNNILWSVSMHLESKARDLIKGLQRQVEHISVRPEVQNLLAKSLDVKLNG